MREAGVVLRFKHNHGVSYPPPIHTLQDVTWNCQVQD